MNTLLFEALMTASMWYLFRVSAGVAADMLGRDIDRLPITAMEHQLRRWRTQGRRISAGLNIAIAVGIEVLALAILIGPTDSITLRVGMLVQFALAIQWLMYLRTCPPRVPSP